MKLPKGFIQLYLIMLLLTSTIIGLTIYILYSTSVEQLKLNLSDTVKNQASMVEAMIESSNFGGGLQKEDIQIDDIIKVMSRSHQIYESMGGLRVFALVEKKGDNINFLMSHQLEKDASFEPVAFDLYSAEPMRKALMGGSGEYTGLDHQGVLVIAAYHPIRKPRLGIVARVNLHSVRLPFIKAGLIAILLSMVFIALGTWIFYKLTDPIVRSIGLNKANLEIALTEVRKSEHKFQGIFNQTLQAVELLDNHGNIIEANRASLNANNTELINMKGKPLWNCPLWQVNIKNAQIIKSSVESAITGESIQREIQISSESGDDIFIDVSIKPIFDEKGDVLFLISEGYNISRQKLIERGLTKSTRAYQLISLCNQAIFQHDQEENLLNEICGLMVDVGNYSMCWIGYAQNDENRSVQLVAQSGVDEGYTKSLDVIWSDSLRGWGPTGRAIRSGKPVTAIDIASDPDFEPWKAKALQYGYVSSVAIPLITDKKIIGAINIYSDNRNSFDENEIELLQALTNDLSFGVGALQSKTEMAQLENQLRQSSKLEAIGTLAGGIAHDFNNLLFAITGYMELALKKTASDSPVANYLDIAIKAGSKAKHLISQILTFSRQRDNHPVVMELAPLMSDAMEMLRSMLPASIEIESTLLEDAVKILADPTQIQQVILNLATNAAQAMEERPGKLEIICKTVIIDRKKGLALEIAPGDYLEMLFKDQGKGMSKELIEQIFDPFFTTKSVDRGTGLGLSVVHGIVRSHEGSISVQSVVNKGTSFLIHIPLFLGHGEKAIPVDGTSAKGSEKILVIDDQPKVANVITLLLQEFGYKVEQLNDPKQVVNLIGKQLQDFDLLITDQNMPGISGVDLIARIRIKHPKLKIIMLTGLSTAIPEDVVKSLDLAGLLQKPVQGDSLRKTVRKVLDQKLGGKLG
ncbi:MAG: response regulator [Proteobacteria bacterium]|nr:response regulator [Pseudomonadota bacterium]